MEEVFGEEFTPIQAILVYEQEKSHSDSKYYLESRRIEHTPKGHQMQEGVPLSKKTVSQLLSGLETNDLETYYCGGIFPQKLLHYQILNLEPRLIWYIPAGYYSLKFSKDLNIPDGQCYLPTLVFKLSKGVLSVFAVKSNKPTESTKLYVAPFHNVFSGGNVCMGSAKVDKANDILHIMENYEEAFFNSKFTHLHSNGPPIKGNLNAVLTNLIKKKGKFDNKLLKPFKGQIIGDLL